MFARACSSMEKPSRSPALLVLRVEQPAHTVLLTVLELMVLMEATRLVELALQRVRWHLRVDLLHPLRRLLPTEQRDRLLLMVLRLVDP